MSSFLFQNPEWFWALLLVPVWLILRGRSGKNASLLFSSIALAKDVQRRSRTRSGQFLFLLRILAVAAIITALARPQLGKGFSEVESSGIDIMLAIDVSGSMNALDFSTRTELVTRIDIVKDTVLDFIKRRPSDRIGMVAFGKYAYLVSPLTLNHDWLIQNTERMNIGLVDGSRTAIGPAIAMSTNRLRDLPAEEKIIILLTDGEDNVMQIPPLAAAEAAAAFDIKIYTIAAGRSGRAPMPRMDRDGNILRNAAGEMMVAGSAYFGVDEEVLKEIADMTGGKFYQALNREELEAIYDEIDRLERTEVRLRHFSEYEELFHWPLLAAILLFSVEQILALLFIRRIPG